MNAFEISTIVKAHGRVQLDGVPFAPGTEVEVSIIAKSPVQERTTAPDDGALIAARERMRELFRTVKGFRNSPRISREDLYERGRLR